MRRRRFLSLSAALAAGHSALAGWCRGEGGAPLVGSLSTDPADYDADRLGALLGEGLNTGLEALRARYGADVQAMASADPKKFAELAGPWVRNGLERLRIPAVDAKVRAGLMEEPALETIQPGPSPPVYYINGMFTPLAAAREEARLLAKRLGKGRAVSLLYNHGADPRVDRSQAGRDLDEAYKDRVWPLYLSGLVSGGSFQALAERLFLGQSVVQHNPTTRQLTHLLYHHGDRDVALVGYSQGALIVRNALYSLALLGKQSFVEGRAYFVAPGLPMHDSEVWPTPKRFTPLVLPGDPIPALLGLRGGNVEWKAMGLAHHRFYEEGYLKQIGPELLGPAEA